METLTSLTQMVLVLSVGVAIIYKILTLSYLARLKKVYPNKWESLGPAGPTSLGSGLKSSNLVANHFMRREFDQLNDAQLKRLGRIINVVGLVALVAFVAFILLVIYVLALRI
jgi:hypothetical protein